MTSSAGEVRKIVTIVFTDLVGSTAISEGLDPETLRHVMSRYFDTMQSTLERHGGTVEKFIGDAIMAVFGIPTLHEDDALRAVRAAVEMRDDLARLNDELARAHDIRFQTRTGVNTGEVVSGDSAAQQKLATGDAVNLAARLEQSAQSGEILIGPETYRLVGASIDVEALDPITVKGKNKPVPAWRVLGLVEGADTGDVATPFVGRQTELAALRNAFAAAAHERTCALATIVGPPGIGKTRLARELAATVRPDARVATGRCLAYGEGVTYAPLTEISAQITSDLAGLLAGEEDATAIQERIGVAVGTSDATASPEEIAWAFRRLFEAAAHDRPLVIVVDDIHWAEPVLLDLLEYVLGFSSGSPILLLCLARPDLFDVRPSWAAPRPNQTLLQIEPLTDDDAHGLIERLERELELNEDAKARIVAAAEGYPLFVEQMLALHADDPHGELVVPPTIQALLAARIDRLDPAERDVLTRASVEGRLFHRGAVAELLPDEERSEVGGHLLSLVRKEFLRPDRARFTGDDGFRFAHVLIRDAAYNAAPKQLRAELHERYARWLERRLRERTDDYLEIIAFHLEQASRYLSELGSPDEALAREAGERLWEAARGASARMDFLSAVSLFERATALLPEDETGALLQEFGAALNRGLDSRARDVVHRAIERAQRSGYRRVELQARLDALWIPAAGAPVQMQYGETARQARELIPELEAVDDDLSLTKAWQLAALGDLCLGRDRAADEALVSALDAARRLGDRLEESEIRVSQLVTAYEGDAPVDECLRRCEEEMHAVSGEWMVEAAALACGAGLHAMLGSFGLARTLFQRYMALCEEFNVFNVQPLFFHRDVEMLAGNSVGAEQWLRRERERLTPHKTWWGLEFAARALIADALCAQGRYDEAMTETDVVPAGVTDWLLPHVRWRAARAKALARVGSQHEAVALAREAAALAEPTDALNMRADALFDQADVLAAYDRDEEAARSLETALTLYERKGNTVMTARTKGLLESEATFATNPPISHVESLNRGTSEPPRIPDLG
jgi:class 3 adenylate cyclase/tetratricopeptide (TPR) repeat protein